MIQPICVYQVQPALALAGWVNSMLRPILIAIKADPVPIEFRPLGRWSGLSAGLPSFNPDGRIKISSLLLYKRRTELVQVVLHEIAHCLLDSIEVGIFHNHNAAFCCFYLILLRRADDAGIDTGNSTAHFFCISLYEHQNPIPHFEHLGSPESVWRPVEMQWIFEMADGYRDSELTAKEIAVAIHEAYFVFADRVADDAAKLASREKAIAQKRADEVALRQQLSDEKTFFKVGFFALLAAFFAIVYSIV